jgi:hypothetical protein
VHVSRDVIFEEDHLWDWSEEEAGDIEPFGMEYILAEGTSPMAMAWPDPPLVAPAWNSLARSSPGSVVMPMRGSEPCTPPVSEVPGMVEHVSPCTVTPVINKEADGVPLQFWSMADLLGGVPQHDAGMTQHIEELLAAIGDEPTIVEDAFKGKLW